MQKAWAKKAAMQNIVNDCYSSVACAVFFAIFMPIHNLF